MDPSIKRLTPFPLRARALDFDAAVTKQLQSELKRLQGEVIPKRNTQHFSHGRNWQTMPAVNGDETGEMQRHSFEFSTRYEDVVARNLDILSNFRRQISEAMNRQFMELLYDTIGRSTEKSGNVVNATEYESMAKAFLATLSKIEFAVDEDGNVNIPEFHLGAQAHAKLIASLEEQGPEFQAEVERIKAEKIAKAREYERERIAKFSSSGDGV